MTSFKRAFVSKFKSFRPTIISIILIVLATYRLFSSGEGILISGVCASIVPFICQFRNYPKDENASDFINVLSDYFLNLLYMLIYLSYVLLVTFIGTKLNPSYVLYPSFYKVMLLGICLNMIFISIVYTIGFILTEKQRLMIGILLCNGQLGIMMISECIVQGQPSIQMYCIGFIALIFCLTLSFIYITYSEKMNTKGKK